MQKIISMIKIFLVMTAEYKKYRVQQDGAHSYTAAVFKTWLKDKFDHKFIDKDLWPPRSPDLN